jgi:hypothetical protein
LLQLSLLLLLLLLLLLETKQYLLCHRMLSRLLLLTDKMAYQSVVVLLLKCATHELVKCPLVFREVGGQGLLMLTAPKGVYRICLQSLMLCSLLGRRCCLRGAGLTTSGLRSQRLHRHRFQSRGEAMLHIRGRLPLLPGRKRGGRGMEAGRRADRTAVVVRLGAVGVSPRG